MERIAKFEKVSFSQFLKDYENANLPFNKDEITKIYDDIILPFRATSGSAGYDFIAPFSFTLKPNETILIPTGIRCEMDEGYVLAIFPRSGLGFKYRLQLNNTVGIIDQDYYNALNEGHIQIKLTNDSKENKTLELEKGKGVAQGIFLAFGITIDDEASSKRLGGFGSTN